MNSLRLFSVRFEHALLLGLLIALAPVTGCERSEPTETEGPLLCYVGGTMRPAMEELVRLYKDRTGQEVQLDYGDSGSLLIRIENEKKGDLYVCHDPFLYVLEGKKLGHGRTVAALTPVIVVPKGNPQAIRVLSDLGREGLSLIMTDFEHSTLGHMLPVIFGKAGNEADIRRNIRTTVRTGGEAANSVGIGRFDAALVWNAVAFLRRDKLDVVPIAPDLLPVPGVDAVTSATGHSYDIGTIRVTVAVLNCSARPEAAEAFVDFVASEDGRKVFEDFGFTLLKEPQQ
jgi:molybdate transport system substrate-binding protein